MKIISTIVTVFALGVTGSALACQPEDPCVDSISGFEMAAMATFEGIGVSKAVGDQVANLVDKSGGSTAEVKADLVGDGCGPDCQDLKIEAHLSAFEQVTTMTAAYGEQSGEEVSANNIGGSAAAIGLMFKSINLAPAPAAPAAQ